MPEIGTSGSMSGDRKRSDAARPKLPRLSSTLPLRHFAALQWRVRSWGQTSRHRRNGMTGEFDPTRT